MGPNPAQLAVEGFTLLCFGLAGLGVVVLALRWAFDVSTIVRRLTEIRDRLPPPAS